MVSALDSGSRGLGSSPGLGLLCCVLGQDTLLSQCLSPPRSINGYPRGKPDKMLRGYLRWTSIPSRRSSNTLSRFMLQKPGKAPTVMGH